jgi:L-cystine transport system permease protein
VPVLYPLAVGYVTFIRGTPDADPLLLIYFGLPMIIDGLAVQFGWSFRSVSIPMIGFAYISFSITAGPICQRWSVPACWRWTVVRLKPPIR